MTPSILGWIEDGRRVQKCVFKGVVSMPVGSNYSINQLRRSCATACLAKV
jgi:hypothetical protein